MRCPVLVLALVSIAGTAWSQPLVNEAVVGAPQDEVWAAFTTSAGLESWMVAHATIDLRIGGSLRTVYAPGGRVGDASTIESTILAFEPGRMLATRVSSAPADFPFPKAVASIWTVLTIEPLGPMTSRVRHVCLGFGADEESQRLRAFFEAGNAATLAALKGRFASKAR